MEDGITLQTSTSPGMRLGTVDRDPGADPGMAWLPRSQAARVAWSEEIGMRYAMKQKLFCWGDDYRILDQDGRDVYFVDGNAFPVLGRRLAFQDMEGKTLAEIHQKLLSWGPTYEIVRDGELAAVVSKHLFTLAFCKFAVDVPGPDDLEATGSFFDYEYTFQRRGSTVATVSKEFFSWNDSYGVDIADGQDDILILASTVVIDLCCHADKSK